MDLLDMGVKMLSGGVTGYLTNNLAIKMLFKKYGPFGGVILKTREEFIHNTSVLVERDIINHQTIEQELIRPEFREVFQKIVSDILDSFLYQNTGEITIGDIPGMGDSLDNFAEFYAQHRDTYVKDVLHLLLPNVSIKDILSDGQINYLTNQFFDLFIEMLEDTEILEQFMLNGVLENGEHNVTDFVSRTIWDKLHHNLLVVTEDFHLKLESFEAEIDQAFKNIYSELKIRKIIKEFESKVKSRSLAEILGEQKGKDISNKLWRRFVGFLRTGEGRDLILFFLNDILLMLKDVDILLIELLDSGLQKNLEDFIEDRLPQVLTGIIQWIEENRSELETLLEEAIEDTLGEESAGFFAGKLKKYLYDMFLKGKAVSAFKIISKIIEGLEEKADIQTLSKEISQEILFFLKTRQVGEMIEILEDNGIINVRELSKLIGRNLNYLVNNVDLSAGDNYFANRIGEIVDFDLTQYFENHLKDSLFHKLQTEFIYSGDLTELLHRELTDKFMKLVQSKVFELVKEEDILANRESFKVGIKAQLKTHQQFLVEKISHSISEFLEGKQLVDIIDQDLQGKMVKSLGDGSLTLVQFWSEEFKKSRVNMYYDLLNDQENVAEDISNIILQLVQQNLHILLEGRIQEVVENNLSQLADEDVLSLVEDFMGRELKPITYFGGLLGLVAAVVFYLSQGLLGENQLLKIPLSIFTYGFVGYITNVIALKMIFRPYGEKKFLGMKIPFTPGVVAREKPRFAQAMGKFVDESLLNKETVEEIFKTNRQVIHNNFYQAVAVDDYQRIEEFLLRDSNLDFISDKAYEGLVNLTPQTKVSLIQRLVNQFQNIDLSKLDSGGLESKIKAAGEKTFLNLPVYLENSVDELLRSEHILSNLIPDLFLQKIYQVLDQGIGYKIADLIEMLKDEQRIVDLLENLQPQFANFQNKKIAELISDAQRDKLRREIPELIIEKIRSVQVTEKILDFIEDKLLIELDPDKTIGELFNGMLIGTLRDNSENMIGKLLDKILEYLGGERERIVQGVLEAAQKEGGILFTLGKFLKVDATITGVINKLIDEKVPTYLELKRDELQGVVQEFIGTIERSKVGDLGIDLSREGLGQVVERLLNNPVVETSLTKLVEGILNSILQVRFGVFMEILELNELEKIWAIFAEEIAETQTSFYTSLAAGQDMVSTETSRVIRKIIDELILTLPVKDLLAGINSTHILQSLSKSVKIIQQAGAFDTILISGIGELGKRVKDKKFVEIVNLQNLQVDLLMTFDYLLKDVQIQIELGEVLGEVVVQVLQNLKEIVDVRTKDYLLTLVIGSALDSVEGNFMDLVNSVNIKDVTEREINSMGAEKIEELFESFAGRYFRKLESYGWVGSVFGLIELLRLVLKI